MGIEWRDNLSIGIAEVDEQHRELFRRFNSFLEACDEGRGAEELYRILQFLDDYVVVHFEKEEKLQQDLGYPGLQEHKEQHRQFEAELTMLKKRFLAEGPSPDLVSTINRTVVGWLMSHIAQKDRSIGAYLRKERGEPDEHSV